MTHERSRTGDISSFTCRFIGENRSRPNRKETSVQEMHACGHALSCFTDGDLLFHDGRADSRPSLCICSLISVMCCSPARSEVGLVCTE